MKIRLSLLLLLISYALPALPHFSDEKDPVVLARQLVEAMTLEEQLGQTLMFSWSDVNPSGEIDRWIEDHNLGGVKVFGWNGYDIESLADTISLYQEKSLANRFGIPLLVATDQEGGIVRHVTDGTALTPGNMSIGASGLPLDAYNAGLLIGQELSAIGINMNFAPNVDLYLRPHEAVVGTRAFSSLAEETAFFSTLWYRGHADAGIVATVKHYPGHGRSEDDSHGILPVIDVSLEELKRDDLLPYRMLIKEGIPAVMASHLAYSRITGETLPASRSEYFLTELLKEEMEFDGMVITDDMIMYGAIMGSVTVEQACEESLRAGCDMLLVSRGKETHDRVWERLLRAAGEDEALVNRIADAAYRVILTKLRWLKGDNHVPYHPDSSLVYKRVPPEGMEDHTLNLAARSITILKDRDGKIPLTGEEKILLVTQDRYIREALVKRAPQADVFDIPSHPRAGELSTRLDKLKGVMDQYDRVVITLRNGYDQFICEELEDWNDRLILMVTSNPSYSEWVPWVDTVILTYLYNFDTTDAALGVLFGDYRAQGRIPSPLKGAE